MKFKILSLLVLLATTAFSQVQTINLKGYGEISVTKNADKHTVDLGRLGTYDCSGSLNPLDLKVKVTLAQLKEFPGYGIFSNIGLIDAGLEISGNGLSVVATADTEKKLGQLCKLLKITSPTVALEAQITRSTFELDGELAFAKDPIKLVGIDKTGTEVKFYSAGLGAAAEPGSVVLKVLTRFLIKPSEFDPDLEVTYEFGYDLIQQTISGAGSMMTDWTDPFGIDQFIDKNSIILKDGAVAISVNLPAATITGVGFALEHGKFFNIDFGVAVSIAPLEKQVLIEASRTKMTMNDISQLLRNGFGLKIKDIFPQDFYLENPEIKFAPTAATIGEAEIEKGFKLQGKAKVSHLLEGEFIFNFDLQNTFHLLIDLNSDFNMVMKAELNKMKKAGIVLPKLENALDNFAFDKLFLELYANKSERQMSGKCYANFTFSGTQHEFDFEATLDGEEIARKLIKKLQETLTSELAVDFAEKSIEMARDASALSKQMMKDARTFGNHSTHTKEHCDTKCVPHRAEELSRHIVDGSYDAVRKFYFNVFPDLGQIKGETPEETRQIRKKLIGNQWKAICAEIDNDWKAVRKDRAYVKYYTTQPSATNGGHLFQAKVDAYQAKEKAYRDKVWERMMTNTSNGNEKARLKGENIPRGVYYIQSVKAGNSTNGYLDIAYNQEQRKWKMKGQRLQIWTKDNSGAKRYIFNRNNYLSYYIITPESDRRYALDCKGRKRSKRTPIHLWSTHKGASQQFYFKHIGEGKFAIIPKMNSKMCLALKDDKNATKGNKVHLWTYSDSPSKQWYLINVKTGKKYIPGR